MDEDSIYSIQTRSFQFSPLFAVDCHTNLFHFSLKWKLDKCVWFFFFNCRKLWLEVPGWFGQGSAPRLVCTTLKAEEHPDEIHKKKSTIFTDEKPTEFHLFSSFSWRKKKERRKTFLDPPPTIIQKRTAVLMDLCLEKRSKQKTKHDFHQFSPPTRIFAIFSRITIKKKVNKWRWLSVLKQKKKTCAKITKYSFLRFEKKKWLPNVQTSFG